jgi:hypothetical protein
MFSLALLGLGFWICGWGLAYGDELLEDGLEVLDGAIVERVDGFGALQ